MSRSRSSEVRFMTPKRWAVIIVLAIGLLLLLINLYIQWAQSGYRQEEREAIQRVKAEAGLTKIESADKFVWDRIVWIVRGELEDGTKLYVWSFADGGDEELQTVPVSDVYPRERIAEDVLREYPNASIIRIRPGYAEGRRIWEVYYSRESGGIERSYYGFYGFEDGAPIETYRLPVQ